MSSLHPGRCSSRQTVLNTNGKRALDDDSDMDAGDRALSQALISSLEGMFQLYHTLRRADLIDTVAEDALNTTESALLALPFADEPGLSPILTHAAALTEALRSSPARRASLTPFTLPDPEVVEFAHSALHRLISGLRDVRTLPVPERGASKRAHTERERARETRPLRLALEARLASAALARSMDNSAAMRCDDTESWDDRAERQLRECLEAAGEAAAASIKSKRANVLLDTVYADDWLPEEWDWPGDSDTDSVASSPEESESEEDAEEEGKYKYIQEPEEVQDDTASPLATLLNLHTRYAEHRTGLWDVLPIGRPSQAAFVHARLGEPFDALGARLLRDLPPESLVELGADSTDVDRWVTRRLRGAKKSGASASGTSRGGSRAGSRASSRAPSRLGTPGPESHETPLEAVKRRMTEEPPAKRQRKGSKLPAPPTPDGPARTRASSIASSKLSLPPSLPPSPEITKLSRASSKASVPPSPDASKRARANSKSSSKASAPPSPAARPNRPRAASRAKLAAAAPEDGAASLPTPESQAASVSPDAKV